MKPFIATVCLLALCLPVHGQGRAKLAREIAESIFGKFGAAAGRNVGHLATRVESLAARWGDDAVMALRKAGPSGIELVEQAGANGGKALRALAAHGVQAEARILTRPLAMKQFLAHGDSAAAALVKHPGVAEPLIERGGAAAVQALSKVEAQVGRRLAILAEGELAKHPEMISVAAKHGSKAVDFMWENRVALAGTAAAVAFIANPEPFLDGSAKLVTATVTATGDAIVKPVAESVAKPAVEGVFTAIHIIVAVLGVLLVAACFLAYRHREALLRGVR